MWNLTVEKTGTEAYVFNTNQFVNQREFVARFKYSNPVRSAKDFVKFLKANFTPAEYFTAMQVDHKAPLTILKEKGYVSYNARKVG